MAASTILATALGIALAMCGIVMIVGRNSLKSVAGVLIGFAGAAVALSYLGLGAALAVVCVVGFAYAILGAAIAVRLFEEYGAIDDADLDKADQAKESARP
jgi:multisubunit Na+/H+ antiporter MnhC subunit